jgi:hypothetical protein
MLQQNISVTSPSLLCILLHAPTKGVSSVWFLDDGDLTVAHVQCLVSGGWRPNASPCPVSGFWAMET